MKEKEEKTIKAWCVVNKRTGKISITNYGTGDNPTYDIYPKTKSGERKVLGSFTGYEEVAECEITITRKHKCNCEYCDRLHWSKRKKED